MISAFFHPSAYRLRYLSLVVAPTALCFLYLGLIASAGYVSRAQVMIEEEATPAAAGAELALGLFSVRGGRSKQDALLVERFMASRTMLEWLDRRLDLRQHFSSDAVDWLGRLGADASEEDFLKFYRDHLRVSIDDESLILDVEFIAHDPGFAQRVTQALVERSESFVNEVSRELAQQQLAFMNAQVDSAHGRLKDASRDLIQLQRQNEVFSPQRESEAVGEILAGLEVELSKQRTQLKALSAFLNPEAPDVVAARQRIQALEDQVRQERGRLVGKESEGLNELMLAYQDAEVNMRLATELYKSALASLESTRLDAVRKVKYLVSVDLPSLPDSAEHPRAAYWTVTVFVMLNLIFFVANLIVATIQDHRE